MRDSWGGGKPGVWLGKNRGKKLLMRERRMIEVKKVRTKKQKINTKQGTNNKKKKDNKKAIFRGPGGVNHKMGEGGSSTQSWGRSD